MKTFALKILASDHVYYEGRALQAVLPARDGLFGVMARHADTVVALDIGEIRFQKEDNSWVTALIGKGIMQFVNNRMTVLAEFVENPEEIDEKRAKKAKEKAEEELRQKQSIQEYHQSQASLARALARLKEKERYLH